LLKIHFLPETWNGITHHLVTCGIPGRRRHWIVSFITQHIAVVYYLQVVVLTMFPKVRLLLDGADEKIMPNL